MAKQTLKQALALIDSGKSKSLGRAAGYLLGLPEGGWSETSEAMRQLREELPLRSEREYTVGEFVDAVYTIGYGGRYASRAR